MVSREYPKLTLAGRTLPREHILGIQEPDWTVTRWTVALPVGNTRTEARYILARSDIRPTGQ